MKFETKIIIARQRAYFNCGWGILNQLKYVIALIGFATMSWRIMTILGIIYGIGCYVLGYLYYKYKWASAETEVINRINPFVKEMREEIKNGRAV